MQNMLAMLMILAAGLLANWLLGRAVERLLWIVRLDNLSDRVGLAWRWLAAV